MGSVGSGVKKCKTPFYKYTYDRKYTFGDTSRLDRGLAQF